MNIAIHRRLVAVGATLALVACTAPSPQLVSRAPLGESTIGLERNANEAASRESESVDGGVCGDPSWLEPPTLKPVYVVFDDAVECDQNWTLFAVGGYGWTILDVKQRRCDTSLGGRDPVYVPPPPGGQRYEAPIATRTLVASWSSTHARAAGVAEYSLEPVPATLVAPVLSDPVTLFVPFDSAFADQRAELVQHGNVLLQMIHELRDPSALPDRFGQLLVLPVDLFTEVDGGFELELRVPNGSTWLGWVRLKRLQMKGRVWLPPSYPPLYGLRGAVSDGRLDMVLDDSREPPSDAHRWPPYR